MLFPTNEAVGRTTTPSNGDAEPIARLVGHVLTYKGLLATGAVIGFLATGAALCFFTPRYDAEAVVIVDSRRNKLADTEAALSSIVIDQYQSALKSELELILSPDVARHVITSLGLLRTPEYASATTHVPTASRFKALRAELLRGAQTVLVSLGLRTVIASSQEQQEDSTTDLAAAPHPQGASAQDAIMQNAIVIFRKSFWAENDPKSLTIRMGYRSASPQLAADVTNAVLKRYLAADEEVKAAAIARSEAWLSGRIVGLRADLNAAEQAVEDFRADHELATFRDHSPLEQELLQLKSRQVDAQAQVSAARTKVLQNHKAGGPEALASSTDVLSSPLIQGLRQQEAVLLAKQAQLSATLLPDNPSMIKIGDELAKVRGVIGGEVGRIAQSNTSDLRQAEMRLADLSDQIASVQAKISAADTADIKLRSLEADAASKRQVQNTFTQRYDQDAGTPLTPPDSRVVSWASVPVDASTPRYGLALAGGTLGFTFLAFCISLGLEKLRSGFGGMQELEEELGLVVAGLTPQLPRRTKSGRRSIVAGDPPPIRELALTVRALAHGPKDDTANRVVLVTSAMAGEGKSTVALSLARSIANGGQRCLLIDADIRNPSLHASLGVPATPGLVELAVDRVGLDTVARQVAGERFDFLPVGRPTTDPLSPFTTEAFGAILAQLKRSYDVIVIDTAPILFAAEGLVLVGRADLTLFLVKWRTTPREIARKAAHLLTRSSAGPCLSVLSQVNLRRMRDGKGRQMEEHYRDAYRFS